MCTAAIGLVGDLSRTVGGETMVGMMDEIMTALVQILSNADVHKSVKPHVISVFGDMALAVGGIHFQKYLEPVLSILSQASLVKVSVLR